MTTRLNRSIPSSVVNVGRFLICRPPGGIRKAAETSREMGIFGELGGTSLVRFLAESIVGYLGERGGDFVVVVIIVAAVVVSTSNVDCCSRLSSSSSIPPPPSLLLHLLLVMLIVMLSFLLHIILLPSSFLLLAVVDERATHNDGDLHPSPSPLRCQPRWSGRNKGR